MLKRSFDPEILRSISEEFLPEDYIPTWINNPRNILLVEDDNLGLATYEYPGLYTVHWFYQCRGRKAIELAKRMCKEMFEEYGAGALRGFTPVDNRAARWASRQVGMASYGIVANADGKEHEMFIMTKEGFK